MSSCAKSVFWHAFLHAHLKITCAKWQSFCLVFHVLINRAHWGVCIRLLYGEWGQIVLCVSEDRLHDAYGFNISIQQCQQILMFASAKHVICLANHCGKCFRLVLVLPLARLEMHICVKSHSYLLCRLWLGVYSLLAYQMNQVDVLSMKSFFTYFKDTKFKSKRIWKNYTYKILSTVAKRHWVKQCS